MGLLNIRNYRNKVLNFIVDIIQYINVKERLFLTISKIMFSIVRMNIVDKLFIMRIKLFLIMWNMMVKIIIMER